MSFISVLLDDKYIFYTADNNFRAGLNQLNECPIDVVRLCVTSDAEREKCERMVEVFRGKDIKPDLDCIMTKKTLATMIVPRIAPRIMHRMKLRTVPHSLRA